MSGLYWVLAVAAVVAVAAVSMLWLARQSRRALLNWYGSASERIVDRLQHRIEPFKFARRPEINDQLMADPVVRRAIEVHAAEHGDALPSTEREVERYIREIVPFFNVLSYYRLGYNLSRFIVSLLYRVRVTVRDSKAPQEIPESDVVVYLMNHRSNADYVVLVFVLSGTVSISYAVGE